VCGQYPGAVPSAKTVSLYCQDNLPKFRYVIVQFPLTNDLMNVCEIEVLVIGIKMTSVLTFSIKCTNLSFSSGKSRDVLHPMYMYGDIK